MVSPEIHAKDRLEAALEKLWERSRFTSYFYQAIDLVEAPEIPTIALAVLRSRLVLYYADPFIRNRLTEEIIGLLVHEMLHVVMNHNHRAFPDEEIYLQNLAQDMVINSYITNNRQTYFSRKGQYTETVPPLELPSGLPLVPQLFIEETGQPDPAWEELYRWLKNLPPEALNELRAGSEERNTSHALPLDNEQAALRHLNQVLQNPLNIPEDCRPDETFIRLGDHTGLAFKDADGRQLPTGVHMMMPREASQQLKAKKESLIQFAAADSRCLDERAFQQINGIISTVKEKDTADWACRMKSLVDFSSQSNEWTYTHGRFNRRYFAQGIYAAGRMFKDKERITVAVDVSGSVIMQPEMLEAVFGVVDDLTRKYTVFLVCIDEQLFVPEIADEQWSRSQNTDSQYIYNRGDWKYIRTGSMGTTFFSPLFNDYMKEHRETLMVITDGEIYDLDKLIPYRPTLWAIPEKQQYRFTAPFGQVVAFNSE